MVEHDFTLEDSCGSVPKTLASFVLECLSKKEKPLFVSDSEIINQFFIRLKEDYPTEFQDIFFDEEGVFPVSKEVENCIMELSSYGILVNESNFESYECKERILNRLEKISEEERNFYREIGKRFYNSLSCDYDGNRRKHARLE